MITRLFLSEAPFFFWHKLFSISSPHGSLCAYRLRMLFIISGQNLGKPLGQGSYKVQRSPGPQQDPPAGGE